MADDQQTARPLAAWAYGETPEEAEAGCRSAAKTK